MESEGNTNIFNWFDSFNNCLYPANIYLLKVNNRNTRAIGVVLVSFLLTLNIFHTFF